MATITDSIALYSSAQNSYPAGDIVKAGSFHLCSPETGCVAGIQGLEGSIASQTIARFLQFSKSQAFSIICPHCLSSSGYHSRCLIKYPPTTKMPKED
ncbi:hypothetical protein Pyn_23530 [Prunus yedoensis var. nudiflora]|uniref:Uncharacterized protein n=1 Tax=Prunus yedoensis var. nudiflora TaxID=2094558 RepID=A0A314YP35_PRUYE|nr:hypothetical protein Pyn_23530 [Prunus yedoensis var. nudiflora]